VAFDAPAYDLPGNFGGVSMRHLPGGVDKSVPSAAPQPKLSVRVRCESLDDLLANGGNLGPVALLKVDVEGFESDVLSGAQQTIAKHRPVIYVENDRKEKSKALIEQLWAFDYELWWSMPPLFNPDNYFKRSDNVYGQVVSINMLCLPKELKVPVEGRKVASSDETVF
jgi:hypothetical protein